MVLMKGSKGSRREGAKSKPSRRTSIDDDDDGSPSLPSTTTNTTTTTTTGATRGMEHLYRRAHLLSPDETDEKAYFLHHPALDHTSDDAWLEEDQDTWTSNPARRKRARLAATLWRYKVPFLVLATLSFLLLSLLSTLLRPANRQLYPAVPRSLSKAETLQYLNKGYDSTKEGYGAGTANLDRYRATLIRIATDIDPSYEEIYGVDSFDFDRLRQDDNTTLSRTLCHLDVECENLLPVPLDLYLTDRQVDPEPPLVTEWRRLNPTTRVHFWNDQRVEAFVRATFPSVDGVVRFVWEKMLPISILKYDLFRLLAVFMEGGYYTDTDTEPLKPLLEWGKDAIDLTHPTLSLFPPPPPTSNSPSSSSPPLLTFKDSSALPNPNLPPPSLIVGIEWSGHTQLNSLNPLYSRSVGVVQWTFGATKGHPVILDAARNVMRNSMRVRRGKSPTCAARGGDGKGSSGGEEECRELEKFLEEEDSPSGPLHFDPEADRMVLEWSGPAVLSDSVARYLRTRWGVPLSSLAAYSHPIRVGDVLILPIASLHARTNFFLKVLDWALGRGLSPWQNKEDLMMHHHKASWWKQKVEVKGVVEKGERQVEGEEVR